MISDIMAWFLQLQAAEQIFLLVGVFSNLLFLGYLAIQVFGGHDAELPDHDFDVGLALLSVRGLTAFGMFLGWTGFVVLKNGFGLAAALIAGTLAGLLAAWLAWRLIRLLLRLQDSGTLDLHNAYRQQGTVYLRIPPKGQGAGKVQIAVQGALRELEAVSDGAEILTGAKVFVLEIIDNQLIVTQVED